MFVLFKLLFSVILVGIKVKYARIMTHLCFITLTHDRSLDENRLNVSHDWRSH